MRASIERCVKTTPVGMSHEALRDLGATLEKRCDRISKLVAWFGDGMSDCRSDRAEWMRYRDNLTFVQWQSLCTTLLSRKVKVEEDIDDGTYTTIQKVQLRTNVFKRMKIHEDDEQMDTMIDAMQDHLKHRIRDLKRIFAFYAAAEDGQEIPWITLNGGASFVIANFKRIGKIFQACG